jgi:hypothetical protein
MVCDSAMDHWPSTGRRSRSSELRPATALANRVGRPAIAEMAAASLHSSPLNPHSSHRSKSTPRFCPLSPSRALKEFSTCHGCAEVPTYPAAVYGGTVIRIRPDSQLLTLVWCLRSSRGSEGPGPTKIRQPAKRQGANARSDEEIP